MGTDLDDDQNIFAFWHPALVDYWPIFKFRAAAMKFHKHSLLSWPQNDIYLHYWII